MVYRHIMGLLLLGIFASFTFIHAEEEVQPPSAEIEKGFLAHGPRGSKGSGGSMGSTGKRGRGGIRGVRGPRGPTGYTGHQGRMGVTGFSGVTGTTGSTGLIGATGATGWSGSFGSVGSSGPTGFTGPIGPTGATGVMGEGLLPTAQIYLQALREVDVGPTGVMVPLPLSNFSTTDSTVFASASNAIQVQKNGAYSAYFFLQALYDATGTSGISPDSPFTGALTVNSTPSWYANMVPYSLAGGPYQVPGHSNDVQGYMAVNQECILQLNASDIVGLSAGPLVNDGIGLPYYYTPYLTTSGVLPRRPGRSAGLILTRLSD
jgi:hypothetical protein